MGLPLQGGAMSPPVAEQLRAAAAWAVDHPGYDVTAPLLRYLARHVEAGALDLSRLARAGCDGKPVERARGAAQEDRDRRVGDVPAGAGGSVKVKILSGYETNTGSAPNDAPTMDPDYARELFGMAAIEVRGDGTFGRWIDPSRVRMDRPWLSLSAERLRDERDVDERAAALVAWHSALRPCEALASRDPGQVTTENGSSFNALSIHQQMRVEMMR
jgi:hypothetical protein